MLDYGSYFSIIFRYGRLMMTDAMGENKIPGRVVPYMNLICEHPGISQEYIARELRMDKGNVARTLKIMEKEGLVTRKSNEKDKRKYELYPTEGMLAIHEQSRVAMEQMEQKMFRGIEPEKLKIFNEVLLAIQNNVLEATDNEEMKCLERCMEQRMIKDVKKRIEEEEESR